MKVFLTGASGFIGMRVAAELLAGGHYVVGMVRSDSGARQLGRMGATPFAGTLEDPDGMARGAADCDAVIHTAFDHDFSNFVANCAKDARAIEAMGAALAGTSRPLIITSGVGMGTPKEGGPAREEIVDWDNPNPRIASERAGAEAAAAGASVAVVRLPQVHDERRQGLISYYIDIARQKGRCGYLGDGANRWSAAHVSDVARLYRLALEKHTPGARYHAVGEEGVAIKAIAEVVAKGLGVSAASLSPDEGRDYFGWFAGFAGLDLSAASSWTRQRLNWQPTGPELLTDLRAMDYRPAS